MGSRSESGGVTPIGSHRIQFDFTVEGRRYRPTLPWVPHEANLRRARVHLAQIRMRIAAGVAARALSKPFQKIKPGELPISPRGETVC